MESEVTMIGAFDMIEAAGLLKDWDTFIFLYGRRMPYKLSDVQDFINEGIRTAKASEEMNDAK